MRYLLCIALTALLCTCATAYSATTSGPRYTLREQVKLNAHHCAEDEYLFVPARRVNDRVIYNTPDHAFCAHIDNIRIAPAD